MSGAKILSAVQTGSRLELGIGFEDGRVQSVTVGPSDTLETLRASLTSAATDAGSLKALLGVFVVGTALDLTPVPPPPPPKPTPEAQAQTAFVAAVAEARRTERIAALPPDLQQLIAEHPEYEALV